METAVDARQSLWCDAESCPRPNTPAARPVPCSGLCWAMVVPPTQRHATSRLAAGPALPRCPSLMGGLAGTPLKAWVRTGPRCVYRLPAALCRACQRSRWATRLVWEIIIFHRSALRSVPLALRAAACEVQTGLNSIHAARRCG